MADDAISTIPASSISLEEASVEQMAVELNRRRIAHILVVERLGNTPEGQVRSTIYMNGCVNRVSALVRMLRETLKLKWGL